MVVKKAMPLLYVLRRCKPVTFKAITKDKNFSKLILQALKELCYNLLYSDLPLNTAQRSKLKRKKQLLIKISTAKNLELAIKHSRTVADCILEPLETSLKTLFDE